MMASASSSLPAARSSRARTRTRWARAGTASRLMSSGTTYSRPSTSAWACEARSRASAPRGLTPRASSGERRVAPTIAIT